MDFIHKAATRLIEGFHEGSKPWFCVLPWSYRCAIWEASRQHHYNDVIMSATATQITGVKIVYWTVCLGPDQRKHQSPTSLAFVRGIDRSPVNSPQKELVTRKMFPFDNVIMLHLAASQISRCSMNYQSAFCGHEVWWKDALRFNE